MVHLTTLLDREHASKVVGESRFWWFIIATKIQDLVVWSSLRRQIPHGKERRIAASSLGIQSGTRYVTLPMQGNRRTRTYGQRLSGTKMVSNTFRCHHPERPHISNFALRSLLRTLRLVHILNDLIHHTRVRQRGCVT